MNNKILLIFLVILPFFSPCFCDGNNSTLNFTDFLNNFINYLTNSTITENLIFNGDFEYGSGSVNFTNPNTWVGDKEYNWFTHGNDGGYVRFTNDSHSGNQSMEIVLKEGGAGKFFVLTMGGGFLLNESNKKNAKLEDNTMYRLSFWYKTEGCPEGIISDSYFKKYDNSHNTLNMQLISSENTWTKYSGNFTTGIDYLEGLVYFSFGAFGVGVEGNPGQRIVFDDIVLEKVIDYSARDKILQLIILTLISLIIVVTIKLIKR